MQQFVLRVVTFSCCSTDDILKGRDHNTYYASGFYTNNAFVRSAIHYSLLSILVEHACQTCLIVYKVGLKDACKLSQLCLQFQISLQIKFDFFCP